MLFLFCEWTEHYVLASEVASLANSETLIPFKKHERWLWFLETRRFGCTLATVSTIFLKFVLRCFCSVYCEDFALTGLICFWHAARPAHQLS